MFGFYLTERNSIIKRSDILQMQVGKHVRTCKHFQTFRRTRRLVCVTVMKHAESESVEISKLLLGCLVFGEFKRQFVACAENPRAIKRPASTRSAEVPLRATTLHPGAGDDWCSCASRLDRKLLPAVLGTPGAPCMNPDN